MADGERLLPEAMALLEQQQLFLLDQLLGCAHAPGQVPVLGHREQEVILREFAMNRDSPDRELSRLFWETAYRVHPYRIPVIGYENIFKSATHTDLVNFFRENYTPDNMIAVVVGDLTAADAKAQLCKEFDGFQRRARAPVVLPVEPGEKS